MYIYHCWFYSQVDSFVFSIFLFSYTTLQKNMLRGRGTLEVRRSDNPFFQPVSSDIGKNLDNANVDWKISGSVPEATTAKHYAVDGNFSFLYTRESDRIGGKVPKPQLTQSKMLTRTEFLKQRRERALLASAGEMAVTGGNNNDNDENNFNLGGTSQFEAPPTPASAEGATFKVDPEAYLRVYKHNPKEEDPRYITSSVRRYHNFLS